MWIAEWSPDSGVEDSVCFITQEKADYFCGTINNKIGKGKGMSAYWHCYEYKPPTPMLLSDALEKYLK